MIKLLKNLLVRQNNSDTILIISFKYLGDTVFTVPAIHRIISKYKNHNITVLCSEENKILYELEFPDFQYLITSREEIGLERSGFNLRFLKICYYSRKLAPRITIDLTSSLKSSIIALFSGADLKLGFGNPRLKSIFDIFEERSKDKNMIDMFLEPVIKLTGENTDIIHTNESDDKKVIKNILITPFAGWKAKEWGLQKFIILGKMLLSDYQVTIVSEAGKIPADVIEYIHNCGLTYKITKSLPELITEIKRCDLFIGNDSGPLYISNLLHKPVFAIFGPTNPKFHKPVFNVNYQYVSKSLQCSPGEQEKMCFTFGGRQGCPAFECMNLLSVESVYNSLTEFIANIS